MKTRQQLSTALYENEGAITLIAKYKKERDEARDALAKVSVGSRNTAGDSDAMQVDSAPLPSSVIAKVDATQTELSKTRRKRPVPEEWATSEQISQYTTVSTSQPLYPGGRTLAVREDLALIGGSDGVAGVYSISGQKVLSALKGGGGAITDGLWAGSRAVVSTASGKVKVFEAQQEVASFSVHAGEASGLALHPSGDILASVGVDKSYVLYDLEANTVLTQVYSDSGSPIPSSRSTRLLTSSSVLTCAKFHPDGHLLAAGGGDGQIKVFDVKSGTEAAAFDLGAPVKALVFSENGIWLAALTDDSSTVSIWDLRKSTEIKSLEMGGKVDTISWDYTGQFLVGGGPGGITVQQYSKSEKAWSIPLQVAVPATAIAWGKDAQNLLAINNEGVLTALGAPA